MTNEEINALTNDQINKMVRDKSDKLALTLARDYCNNPLAMMSISESERISIVFDSADTVTAIHGGVSVSGGECVFSGCKHWQEPRDRYCRAVAIVYLKMKGVL